MELTTALVAFGVIFVGELPDKTMFASLVLATSGRPLPVWLGAAAAFVVHAAIAVTVGAALFALLPHRALEAVVAAAFLAGAGWSWRSATHDGEEGEELPRIPSARNVALSAFAVIFVAEWGDLTQVLTADLAARYGAPLVVAVAAVAALWLVAGIAVTSGRFLVRILPVRRIRQVTAVVLLVLAAYAAVAAAR